MYIVLTLIGEMQLKSFSLYLGTCDNKVSLKFARLPKSMKTADLVTKVNGEKVAKTVSVKQNSRN